MSLSLWTRLFNWRQLRRTPTPPFIIVTAAESSSTVDKGTTRVVRVSVVRSGGTRYTGTLTPTTNSLPSGVTATFSPATLSVADGFTDMSLIVDAGAGSITDDAYTVTLSGTGINAKTINQTITVPNPLPPEAISIAPDDDTVSVVQGQTVDITYTLTREGAYMTDVPLSVIGLPSGVTASYPDGQTFQGSEQTKRVRLTADIAASTVTNDAFTVTAAGNGGSVTDATDNGTVTVTAVVSGPASPLREDDFTSYADTAAFFANVGTFAAGKTYEQIAGTSTSGNVTIDPTVTYNGHQTVRCRVWSSGGTTAPFIIFNNPTLTNAWIRTVRRWTPGYCNAINNGYTYNKSQKTSNYSLSGVQGRVLSAISNGSGSPGAVGNSGDFFYEVQHRTGNENVASAYHYSVLRSANQGGNDSMYDNGSWYEEVLHFERVATGHVRVRVWFQLDGATRTLLCTHDSKDIEYPAPAGIGNCKILDNFNALNGGAPGTGVDQSVHIGEWQVYDESLTPDPFGLGYTAGENVTVDMSIDDDTIALTAGGASVQQTITVTRGSAISDKTAVISKGDTWPTGLNVSFSATRLNTGTNTCTATFSASGAVAPGTYTEYINVLTDGKKGVGAASDYITLTFTVT